eukprot:jgi/Mesvir1/19279/Mv10355-RA.2
MSRTRSAAAPRPGHDTAPDPGVPRAVSIPAIAKKHVEQIKQIVVGATEEEIYVEYKACNCDVTETIDRLTKNPFEEVKGKKKKHKEEVKKPQEQSFGSGAPYGANYGTGSTYGAPHSSSDSKATRPSSGGGFRGGRGGGRWGGRADAQGRGSGGAQQQVPAFGGHPARENGIHPRSAGSGAPASSAGTWGQAAKGPGAEARPVAQTGAGQGVSAPAVGSAGGDSRGTLFSRASPATSGGWGDSGAAASSSSTVPSTSTGGGVPVASGWGSAAGHRSAVDVVKSGGLHQQQAAQQQAQQAQAHAQPDVTPASSGYESGSSSGPNGGFSSQSDALLRNAAAPGSRPSSAAPGRAPAAVGSQIGAQAAAGGAKDTSAGAGDRVGGAGAMMGGMSSMGLGAAQSSAGAEAGSQGEADAGSLSMSHQMGVRGGATGWGGTDSAYDATSVSKVDNAVTKMKDLSIGSTPAPATGSSLGDAAVIMPPSLQMQAGHTGLSFGSFGDGFSFSGFSAAATGESVPSTSQGMQGASRAPGAASAASANAVGGGLKDSAPSGQDSTSANQLASSGVSLANSGSQGSYSVPSDSSNQAQGSAPAQQAQRQLPVKAAQPSSTAAAVTNILPMAPGGAVAAQGYGSYGVPPMTGSYGFNASPMPTGGAGTFGSPYDAGVEAQADIARQTGLYQDASSAMLYSQPFRPSAVDASGIDTTKYGLGATVASASSASTTSRYMQPASSAVVGPSSSAASLPSTLPSSAGGAAASGSNAASSASQSSSQSSVSATPAAPQLQPRQQQQQQAAQQAPAVHPAVPSHQHQHQAALQPPLAMQQQHSQFAGTPGMGPSAAQYGNTAMYAAPAAYYMPPNAYYMQPYQYTASTPGYPQGPTQATTFPQGAGGSYGAPSTGGPVKFPNNQFTNPYSKMSGSNAGGGVPHAAGSSRGYNTGYSAQHYATGTVAPGAAGSAGGYEDMSAGQYKQDTSLFIPSQQQQIPRDMAAGMPTTSYYNLQAQGQYTHGQQQPTHHAYAGMYHPSQGAQPAHQIMQAQATMGAGQPSAGGYNQPLRDGQQLSWNNTSY